LGPVGERPLKTAATYRIPSVCDQRAAGRARLTAKRDGLLSSRVRRKFHQFSGRNERNVRSGEGGSRSGRELGRAEPGGAVGKGGPGGTRHDRRSAGGQSWHFRRLE